VGLATRYYFLSECCCPKFTVLYLLDDHEAEYKNQVQHKEYERVKTIINNNTNNNSMASVCERTIATERPPLVDGVSVNFWG
jgi:hypothetical protein